MCRFLTKVIYRKVEDRSQIAIGRWRSACQLLKQRKFVLVYWKNLLDSEGLAMASNEVTRKQRRPMDMEQTRTSPTIEAAIRLLKRIGIDQFVASVRGQDTGDYRMQTMSEV